MVSISFALIALIATGLIAGSTFYITFIEIAARKKADHRTQLSNWQLIFPPAGKFLRALGTGTLLISIAAGIFTENGLWYLSALFMVALIPFTLIKIAPTNTKLLAIKLDKANEESTLLLEEWAKLHHIRTALSLLAFISAVLAFGNIM